MAVRQPTNLMQAIENVAGVNQVSEGQAAVPAIRGLARGRTLILIDGARVSSERRVGASATFLDPSLIEGVDVSRGPGSVAYGSDAFGGVISVRTRRVDPGVAVGGPVQRHRRRGHARTARRDRDCRRACRQAACCSPRTRARRTTGTAPKAKSSTPASADRGLHAARRAEGWRRRTLTAGWQSDFGRDIERPRNNSRTVRFLLSRTRIRIASLPDMRPRNVMGLQRLAVTALRSATTISGPIRIGSPPPRPAAASSAPTSRPTTFTCAASASSCRQVARRSLASTSTAASA